MAFNQAHDFDLNDCTFTNVGKDQNVVNNVTLVFNVSGDLTMTAPSTSNNGSLLRLPYTKLPGIDPGSPLFPPDEDRQDPGTIIIQIQQLLFETTRESKIYRKIKSDFDALFRAIYFVQCGASLLHGTPIRGSIVRALEGRLRESAAVLHSLHSEITAYRDGLTRKIGGLWRNVYWAGQDLARLDAILTTVRQKLAGIRWPIDALLAAMTSNVWKELARGSRLPLEDIETFYANIRVHFPSLVHIKYQSLTVIDHLGASIPIPLEICSSHEDLNFILKGYCRERIGSSFIDKGDYQVIRSRDNRIVNSKEFSGMAKPESVFEISIILRRATNNKNICPRCRKTNLRVRDEDWIECSRCSGKYCVYLETIGNDDERSPQPDRSYLNQRNVSKPHNPIPEDSSDEAISRENKSQQSNDQLGTFSGRLSNETSFFRRISVRHAVHDVDLQLHRLISYSQRGPHRCAILWDVRSAPSLSARHTASPGGLAEPEFIQYATNPPTPILHVICDIFPVEWPIIAQNENGVTIGDVLNSIYAFLRLPLRLDEWEKLSVKSQRSIAGVFDTRWSNSTIPETTRSKGVLRVDCIRRQTQFAGLTMVFGVANSCIMTLAPSGQ